MRVGTHGMMQVDYEQRCDFDRMREHRVSRIKKYMDEFGVDVLLLFDTGNKRYSTSTAVASPEVDNMGRYAIIPRNGYPHIFGFGSEVAAEKLYCPWIADTTFPAHGTMYGALPAQWKCYDGFLKDVDMVLANHNLNKKEVQIGIDVGEAQIFLAMQEHGYNVCDGQSVMQYARAIKNEDEIMCLKWGAAIVDAAFHKIASTIQPGMKENDLQAVAAHEMHRLGAQWVHNVQVTSGNRTHPHPHLSSDRLIQPGDMIFMDIVCLVNGYHTCVYRCFCCGQADCEAKRDPCTLPGIPVGRHRSSQARNDYRGHCDRLAGLQADGCQGRARDIWPAVWSWHRRRFMGIFRSFHAPTASSTR